MYRQLALLTLVLMLFLAGCATTAAPTTTPDDVAREFVTALGVWDEPTIRRLSIPNATTEIVLASQEGQWNTWTQDRLGPQTSVEVAESTVDENRATIVVRSLHEKGESGVRLSMMQMDGAWMVETWKSYRE